MTAIAAPRDAVGPGRLESAATVALASSLALQAVQRPFALSLAGRPLLLADVAFLVALALAAVSGPAVRRRLLEPRRVLPLAAYAVALVASVPGSLDVRTSVKKLVLVGSLFALAGTVSALGRTPAARAQLARGVVAGGVVTTVVSWAAVVGFAAGFRDRAVNLGLSVYGSLPPGPYPRVRGLFENMNQACSHLALAFALVAVGLGPGLRPLRRAALAVAMAVAGLFTLSVGFAGILLVSAETLLRTGRGQPRARLHAVLAASSALLATGLVASVLVPTSGGTSIRARIFAEAFATFRAHPLFGTGVGIPPVDVRWMNPSGVPEHLGEAHNVVLSLLAQEGVVGLVGFGCLVAGALAPAVAVARSAQGEAALARGVVLGLVACLGISGVGASIEDARHVFAALGLALAFVPERGASEQLAS